MKNFELISASILWLLIFMILLSVAFFTLLERKILGLSHIRLGPSKIFIKGLLQPFSDALKLMSKDDSYLSWSNHILFFMSPFLMFFLSLLVWITFPFLEKNINFEFSIVMIIIIIGMSVYGLIFPSWSSNSKYSIIGGMRAVSQSLSYEIMISFIFLSIISVMSGYDISILGELKSTSIMMMCPLLGLLLIVGVLVELNRSPFDLSEGESELVSGFCVEYGSMQYTVIFLSENTFLVFSSFLLSYFLFSKFNLIFHSFLWVMMMFIVCLVRSSLPRIRYDMLVMMCWLIMMPITIVMFLMFSMSSKLSKVLISILTS